MYVLRVTNTDLYISINNGFFDRVDVKSSAFQMARMQDANDLQSILDVETVIESV